MITFKTLRWKNLLSTGNVFTEIPLNKHSNALIIGDNGSGKSTMLDALTFVLFGKPFRKINKNNLVNSINNKNCIVQIEFETGGKEYKISRGIKPNIFEIWCDGTMINQDSKSIDYQEHLETYILKMNYKAFTQIVILGSASWLPFMQLSPSDRRLVIDNLLDINVFSVMQAIVKQRKSENASSIEKNSVESRMTSEKKKFLERSINNMKVDAENSIKLVESDILAKKSIIEECENEIAKIEKRIDEIRKDMADRSKIDKKILSLVELHSKLESKTHSTLKQKKFLECHNECPTCTQSIDDSFRKNEIAKLVEQIEECTKAMEDINVLIKTENSKMKILDEKSKKIAGLEREISSKNFIKASAKDFIKKAEAELTNKNSTSVALHDAEESLKQAEESEQILEEERKILLKDRLIIDDTLVMLKDDGIKSRVVHQYLPVINKSINKYLSDMGFMVNFEIDENFDETIKSRYRDTFSYNNFSEGEKMRIDLALLFTWRHIAALRNNVNTNLLILDEVFDSSLDSTGTDEFIKIMWDMIGEANVFVISHKQDQLLDKFKTVYKAHKKQNFSVMEEQK